MHYKNIKLYSYTFFLCLLIFGCGQDKSIEKNYQNHYDIESGGRLINAMTGEPSNLIAMIAGDSASSAIANNIFNSLLKYDESLNYSPDIAESWSISNNQKTITFKIREGLFWADGEKLTSKDVMFTWKLVTDPNTRTPYASDYQLVKKATTPDPYTFTVTYEESYAPALDTWTSLHILPEHLLKNEDVNSTYFSRKPVGSNYYKLKNWKSGQQVSLTRNTLSINGKANMII